MDMACAKVRRVGPSWRAIVLFASVLAIFCGCDLARTVAVYTAPASERVPAEYDRLRGKNVLVYVWVPPEIKWDYPYIRLDVAGYVGTYLRDNVRDVTIVDPRQVEDFLEQHGYQPLEPATLGARFEADSVVHLSVHRFSLRERGMAHFYRGRMASAVTVYELNSAAEAPERFPLRGVEVAFPAEQPVDFANAHASQIMQGTFEVFAVEVGRKFHSWNRPLD